MSAACKPHLVHLLHLLSIRCYASHRCYIPTGYFFLSPFFFLEISAPERPNTSWHILFRMPLLYLSLKKGWHRPGFETIGQRLEGRIAQCFWEVGISAGVVCQISTLWIRQLHSTTMMSIAQTKFVPACHFSSIVSSLGSLFVFCHWFHGELKPRYV